MTRVWPAGVLLLAIAAVAADAPANKLAGPAKKDKRPFPGYTQVTVEGFKLLLSDEVVSHEQDAYQRSPREVLALELKALVKTLPPRALKVVRNLLIWVEWEEDQSMGNGREGFALASYYGGHQLGLLAKGKNPLKAKTVTILRMKSLTEEHQPDRDSGRCVILHEIAHAVHDQLVGRESPAVKLAYRQAMERRLYDPKLYIATNDSEFFAEASCAWFDQLDYYPRTRAELRKYDPATAKLMEGVWGKPAKEPEPEAKKPADVAGQTLDKVNFGTAVSGPAASAEAFAGKPTLVVYWNCLNDSSLTGLNKLAAWHVELGPFGLAAAAVHLTGAQAGDMAETARERNVVCAVTEAPFAADGPVKDQKEFPVAAVFDAKGACVYKGTLFDAEPAVRAALGSALADAAGVLEWPAAVRPHAEALRKGTKSPTAVLSALADVSRRGPPDAAAAARKLVEAVCREGAKALDAARGKAGGDPFAAYLAVEKFPAAFKDTALAAKASEQLAKWKQQKEVASELRARALFGKVLQIDTELMTRPGGFQPQSDEFKRQNALLIRQVQEGVRQVRKAYPKSKAAEDADRLARKYGLVDVAVGK